MAFFSRRRKERQKPEAWVTPEERAASNLGIAIAEGAVEDEQIVVLDKDLERKKAQAQEQKAAETAEALAPTPPPEAQRGALRALLVTTDVSLCTAGSPLEAEYAALTGYLDEFHIIVITLREAGLYNPRRIAPNVWVYPTNSRSRLFSPYDAYKIARKQLAFAAGFRADIVIATDAFVAGVAAYAVARRYDRPLQIQLATDPSEADDPREEGNRWRSFTARFVMPRADCIVVRGARLQAILGKRYQESAGRISVLPPFYNLSSFRDTAPTSDLRERHPQFKFVILAVSRLDAHSTIGFAIDTCAPFLRQYPTVGMVIVGEGPLRAQLERKVASDNLENRVAFESDASNLVSYMKSANLFLNVSADEEHDTLLAASAAAGLPVLTVESNMASILFEDGVNAFVCPLGDMVCLQARIGEFLNDNQIRDAFALNGRDQVFSVIEQDIESYRQHFIGSFESCMVKTYTEKNDISKNIS